MVSQLNDFNHSISILIDKDKKKDNDIEELRQKVARLEANKPNLELCKNGESSSDQFGMNGMIEHVDKMGKNEKGRHERAWRLVPLTLLENK